jgi:hypothetical protein
MFIFDKHEYLTFIFQDEEEHLVPSAYFHKSETVDKLKDIDNQVRIDNIASSTFGDLTNFLKGDHPKLEAERIELMIEAAKQLGLPDVAKTLSLRLLPPDA